MGNSKVNPLRIGIIGCGLIGKKRAKTLSDAVLVGCADADVSRAQHFAAEFAQCTVYQDWQSLVSDKNVDAIVIATPHHVLAEIALASVQAGKHVLIEKPAARIAEELNPVLSAAQSNNVCVRVGFNHRYHRAFQKARALVDANALGPLMFVRARYGHGGRIGYDQEWRAIPAISGGGELIDQGVHLIDLARWFLGDFTQVEGYAHTYFWQMPVDDNAFLLLKTSDAQVAFLHASCTEWKNTFSFELYGKYGKLEVQGLGGSYGVERLTFYRMLPEMGPPETTVWEYPMADNSWEIEFAEFIQDIALKREPSANLKDAIASLKVVERIYALSQT